MSISSSLYIGTTGIIAQQTSMDVISDNIANVGTLGFKGARTLFQNLLSEQLAGASVGNQLGLGASVSSVYRTMDAGPLETTKEGTDLAIGGTGFFIVSPEGSDKTYYTRAGNFRFHEDGYLRDPHGNILQGHALKSGVEPDPQQTTDIRLDKNNEGQFVSIPEATTALQMMLNLDSIAQEQTTSTSSPYAALFERWDASNAEPLPANAYAYADTLTVYDSTGAAHQLRAYFDPVTANVTNANSGERTWEYLVTIPPADDASGLVQKKGICMAGTMTFNAAGELLNMSAFSGNSDDPATWTPTPLSAEGLPLFEMQTTGSAPTQVSMNFGLKGANWVVPSGTASMADVGTSFAALPRMDAPLRNALSCSNYAQGNSVSMYQNQNGYAKGYFQSASVDKNGVLVASYSNGQTQELFKIPLADCINPQGLHREGGNLFSATKDSGAMTVDWAGQGRLGSIAPNSLEGSNVDLATEFVAMINTQRAFDANSKVITTADQVIQTALGVKK
ncbi:flagellar hook protein FlgE [Desulfovibrionales bacterium]